MFSYLKKTLLLLTSRKWYVKFPFLSLVHTPVTIDFPPFGWKKMKCRMNVWRSLSGIRAVIMKFMNVSLTDLILLYYHLSSWPSPTSFSSFFCYYSQCHHGLNHSFFVHFLTFSAIFTSRCLKSCALTCDVCVRKRERREKRGRENLSVASWKVFNKKASHFWHQNFYAYF